MITWVSIWTHMGSMARRFFGRSHIRACSRRSWLMITFGLSESADSYLTYDTFDDLLLYTLIRNRDLIQQGSS